MVKTYAAYVLMGFLHPEEFSSEIQMALSLPPEVARPLGEDLQKKVFSQHADEIQKIYAPASPAKEMKTPELGITIEDGEIEGAAPEKKTITFAGLRKEAAEPEEKLPITVSEKPPIEAGKGEENPFILQEEKPVAETSQPFLKKFSFSLGGFFGKKKEEQQIEKPVKAKIDLFGGPKEDQEKKVVHYSELRTPLGESIFKPAEAAKTAVPAPIAPEAISPEIPGGGTVKKAPWSFKWFGAQAPARDEQKNVPVHEAVGAPAEEIKEKQEGDVPKNGGEGAPHLEGNIIDLRK